MPPVSGSPPSSRRDNVIGRRQWRRRRGRMPERASRLGLTCASTNRSGSRSPRNHTPCIVIGGFYFHFFYQKKTQKHGEKVLDRTTILCNSPPSYMAPWRRRRRTDLTYIIMHCYVPSIIIWYSTGCIRSSGWWYAGAGRRMKLDTGPHRRP